VYWASWSQCRTGAQSVSHTWDYAHSVYVRSGPSGVRRAAQMEPKGMIYSSHKMLLLSPIFACQTWM
jgi:hypothetical protein